LLGPVRDRRRSAVRAALVTAGLLVLAAGLPAAAHEPTPLEAAAELARGPLAAELGVVAARPHPGLPRLLHVEVDERWHGAAPERRLRAAGAWRALWRESTAGGLVVVTDAHGLSLVGFDAQGRPTLAGATRALDAGSADRGPSH
jgi:hypothetical protein